MIYMNNKCSVRETSVKKQIKEIHFDILAYDIVQQSALAGTTEFDITDLYDKQEPKRGGLIDPHIMNTEFFYLCPICHLQNKYCDGHPYYFNYGKNYESNYESKNLDTEVRRK